MLSLKYTLNHNIHLITIYMVIKLIGKHDLKMVDAASKPNGATRI